MESFIDIWQKTRKYKSFYIRRDNQHQDLTPIFEAYEQDCYKIKGLKFNTVVDVGAHVGAFSRLAYETNPHARIFAIECCPENIPILKLNAPFAEVINAAMTYDKEEVVLLNSVFTNCAATGGSILCHEADLEAFDKNLYWADRRPIKKITLEEIPVEIDILKLDCEGSEFNILANADLSRVKLIVGEYHGKQRFLDLVSKLNKKLTILRDGELGIFWLE